MALILIVAAVVYAFLGKPLKTIAILAIVVLLEARIAVAAYLCIVESNNLRT